MSRTWRSLLEKERSQNKLALQIKRKILRSKTNSLETVRPGPQTPHTYFFRMALSIVSALGYTAYGNTGGYIIQH